MSANVNAGAALHATSRSAPGARLLCGWLWVARSTAIVTLAGAAVIHESVIEAHYGQWAVEGAFFSLLAITEAFLALTLLASRSRSFFTATIAVSLGTVALWTLSRTVGVPVGPGAGVAEPVGRPDSIATLLELATAVCLLPLVVRKPGRAATVVLSATLASLVALATAFAVRGGVDERGHAVAGASGHEGRGQAPLPANFVRGQYFVAQSPLGPLDLKLGVGPATAGINTIDLVVQDQIGARPDLDDVRVSARLPRSGRAPLQFVADRLAPGHYVVDVARLPTAGWWHLRIGAQAADFGPVSTTIVVPIRK